jgi:hypothetical protein
MTCTARIRGFCEDDHGDPVVELEVIDRSMRSSEIENPDRNAVRYPAGIG